MSTATWTYAGIVSIIGMFSMSITVDASVRITEIMYNAEGADTGKEYVEIINTGPDILNIGDIVFSEHGRDHKVSGTQKSILQSGDIAIIVANPEQFTQHYTAETIIIDSSNFALNNTQSKIQIKQNGEVVHEVNYKKQDGANGDGNALHISNSDAITANTQSPGIVRGITIMKANRSTEERDAKSNDQMMDDIEIIVAPEILFPTSSNTLSAYERKEDKKKLVYGAWNFGDGVYIFGKTVEHTYTHPGTYILSFQKVEDNELVEESTVHQEVIVETPQIKIERISSTAIRIYNNHNVVLNVSDWKILSGDTRFSFPDESYIQANSTITIGFSTERNATILFRTKGGGTFNGTKSQQGKISKVENITPKVDVKTINKETLPSTQAHSATEIINTNKYNNKEKIFLWIALLIGLITIVIAPVLLESSKNKK